MGFLKKHYEKILLAVLLTVFICLLAFQLVLWRQNELIQVEKMKGFREPPPNYQQQKFEDAASPFRALETLPEKPLWRVAMSRDGNQRLFTDLMVPYTMALCPYCNRVIPANSFPAGEGVGECPFPDCKKNLRAPYNLTQEKDLDTDGDGIPDKEEIRMGLNPKDGSDAAVDSDDDGFSNYEEFVSKTDMRNAKSRPPYHEKLFVRSIIRAKLPFRLKNVSFTDKRVKENAQIQLEIERPRRQVRFQTIFVRLNEGFPKAAGLNQRNAPPPYKVIDVIPKFTKENGFEVNASQVVVQKRSNGEKIVLDIGKDVFEPKIKAVLALNLVNDLKEYEVYVGSKFQNGIEMKTGVDRYEVVDIDQQKNTVTVKYTGDNPNYRDKTFVIEKHSILQRKIDAARKNARPRRPKKATTNN